MHGRDLFWLDALLGVFSVSYLTFVCCKSTIDFPFLGIMGVVKKLSKEEGWEFIPPLKDHVQGSLYGVRHDWTLMEERPKNWTNKD